MSKGAKTSCGIFLVIILIPVLVLGYLGIIPGVSAIFGSNKPRDLGVTYTEQDRTNARGKSQVEYAELPAGTADEASVQRVGSRPVNTTFSSAEITALMNNRPYKSWPYKNVQMKFNADGSAEISGQLIKSNLPAYCSSIGIPKNVVEKVMKYLPGNPVYYVKGKAVLDNNQVSVLEPSKVEVGRLSIPVGLLLSASNSYTAYAEDSATGELGKYSGKKAAIVNYINSHLAGIKGFFAKKAYFSENQLHFDGNLNEKELTVR